MRKARRLFAAFLITFSLPSSLPAETGTVIEVHDHISMEVVCESGTRSKREGGRFLEPQKCRTVGGANWKAGKVQVGEQAVQIGEMTELTHDVFQIPQVILRIDNGGTATLEGSSNGYLNEEKVLSGDLRTLSSNLPYSWPSDISVVVHFLEILEEAQPVASSTERTPASVKVGAPNEPVTYSSPTTNELLGVGSSEDLFRYLAPTHPEETPVPTGP